MREVAKVALLLTCPLIAYYPGVITFFYLYVTQSKKLICSFPRGGIADTWEKIIEKTINILF